ncbi:hypothetical protein BKA70DRAFT_539473 [Coprinopsis sp. MPI-PUGE-AT-0042]|nr:hypothetical protein BKA70DRAFT_539473 [Coprinopsis sp. MPI-PUGE-AT-0042]
MDTYLNPKKLPLLEAGIPRLNNYARHVKVLRNDIEEEYVEQITGPCLLALLAYPNFPRPIFPNLRTVIVPSNDTKFMMLYASLLLEPSVRSLEITAAIYVSTDRALLDLELFWKSISDRLDPLSEKLEVLKVTYYQNNATMPAQVPASGVIEGIFKKLASIETLHIPDALLLMEPFQLSRTLKTLELTINDMTTPRETVNLPNLPNLRITVSSTTGCNNFLRSLQAAQLQRLSIVYDWSVSYREINLTDAFVALLESSSFPHLSSITVTKNGTSDGDARRGELSAYRVAFNTFKPLIACQNLSELRIATCNPTQITNSQLLQMLSAWPKLKTLKLECDSRTTNVPRITFAGLHAALLRCPSLSHLDLPCNARTLPSKDIHPHPALTHWNVRGSPLESSKVANKTLAACFPQLQVLRAFEELCTRVMYHHDEYWDVDAERIISIVQWLEVQKALQGEM